METGKENVYDFDALLNCVNENVKTLVNLETKVPRLPEHKKVSRERRPFHERNVNNQELTSPKLKLQWAEAGKNVIPLEKEMSFLTNQIVSLASRITDFFYCPFCPLRYKKQPNLKLHVKQNHRSELEILRARNVTDFNFQSCPHCSAKFYLKGICMKHFVTYHNQLIAELWDQLTGGKQKSQCQFCQTDFQEMKTDAILKHFFTSHSSEFEENVFQLAQLNPTKDCSIRKDHITELMSPSDGQLNLRSDVKKSAKRSLRFSVPEAVCHVYDDPIVCRGEESAEEVEQTATNEGLKPSDDDNCPTAATTDLSWTPAKTCFALRRKKSRSPKPKFTSTPLKRDKRFGQKIKQKFHVLFHTKLSPRSPSKPYRCCLCRSRFVLNQDLVKHAKLHVGFGFQLQPVYGCGICTAQFYENSFLLKHCSDLHLTYVFTPPKCLLAQSPSFK